MENVGKHHVSQLAIDAAVTVTFAGDGVTRVLIHPDFEVEPSQIVYALRTLADEMEAGQYIEGVARG